MAKLATKFVNWDVPTLDALKDSRAYMLRAKLNNGEKLNREEKKWLTKGVNSNTYFNDAIPVLGWKFDFSDALHTFLVKQYGRWTEYKAADKTAMREYLEGKVDNIIAL